MMEDHHRRGGAAVGILDSLDPWESHTVIKLRLWCDGPRGQTQVRNAFRQALPELAAQDECRAFENLIRIITQSAHRPLVRHSLGCACVGADEGVFLHLVRTASEGQLGDASLIATLLVGAAYAENVALLAGQVGACARQIHTSKPKAPQETAPNVVRLH